MLVVPVDGASLAASPPKQASMLVVFVPIAEPATFDKVAEELQLVVQPLAGTRFAVPKTVPVHAEPE
jgi:hypothetical protein